MQPMVPVVSATGKPLMPTTHRRANRLLARGRALRRFDRGLFYIKLLDRADGYTQPVALGIDPGSKREAFVVQSPQHTLLNIQAEAVTWAQQRRFEAEWFQHAELVATEGLVEAQRRVKDDGELARMAEAARIADDALANVRPLLGDGLTEKEIALALDYEMRRLGAEASSFETIVASGPNGAKPHARPSERAIGAGELVVIDFGAVVEGYCSDMTRTLCVGEPASDVARRMVEVVIAVPCSSLLPPRASPPRTQGS